MCIFVVLVLDSCSLRLSCSMREPETKFMCEYFFREIVYAKKMSWIEKLKLNRQYK